MTRARYDEIGVGYTGTRGPDPRIAAVIHDALGASATVLNVGAGTGSYEPADRTVVAIDPSAEMLAQRPDNHAAVRGVAEDLPFADDSFDAAMALLTVHHWSRLEVGLRECRRVARDRVVLFTWEGERSNGYADWFADYFPEAMRIADGFRSPLTRLASVFGRMDVVSVPIPRDCADMFGGALWGRPEAVLDPAVWRGSSSFAMAGTEAMRRGAALLARDLATGAWDARHGHLRHAESLDLGFCVVVAQT